MPQARLYLIADATIVTQLDTAASEWGPMDGATTFSEGRPLSADGGSTITHKAANTLADHPAFEGQPIDVDRLIETFASTPAMDVYECDDPFGSGTVYRLDVLGADAIEKTEIGTGDLQTLALEDAGLVVYETEGIEGTPEWEPGVFYGTQSEYDAYTGEAGYGGREALYEGTTYQTIDGQGHVSQVGWEPPNVPSLWEQTS